jgi:aromatic ring-opening dioxygenase catalytic subunit (LigB family)
VVSELWVKVLMVVMEPQPTTPVVAVALAPKVARAWQAPLERAVQELHLQLLDHP